MYTLLSNAQAKQYIDAAQIHEGLLDAKLKAQDYAGGMHWKTVSGKEYLYRTLDRHGNAKSLGPRSPKTEQILSDFVRRKMSVSERLISFRENSETNTRVNAALRLGAVPNEVADVCIALNDAHLMGKSIMVIGTNAMHAYEALAGVRFPSDIMATVDVDLLWNHKTKLCLGASQAVDQTGLLGVLQKADRSYTQDENNPYRARSKSGFMVDLIRQMPDPPWADEPDRFFEQDLIAADIKNASWLLGAPRITQPVVAVDGRTFMVTAPDPRAFAIYKLWLSTAGDREPYKRPRDLRQAQVLIELIEERLPHLNNWGEMHSFPDEVLGRAQAHVDRVRQQMK